MLNQIDQIVTLASSLLLALTVIPIGMTLCRMLMGPGHGDRFVALDMLTGIAVATAALASVVTQRREFMDVGLGLAIFGFVGTCALAAFLEKRIKA